MLEDAEYRALQEQVHLLQELTKHEGWQELVAIAHDLMEPVKKGVLNGLSKSHEDYLRSSWLCVGVHKVLDIPAMTFAKLEEERKQRIDKNEPLT